MESPTRGTDSRIYFSIPLNPNLMHDPSVNALDLLFDPSAISGLNTVATPDFIKTVLPPKNRPQLTIDGDIDSPKSLTGGSQDHDNVSDDDIIGISGTTGIKALDVKDDVSLICIPGKIGEAKPKDIMEGGMAYCENRSLQDCFFIADMPKECLTPTEAKDFVKNDLTKKSDFGAIYYPWIKVTDPIGTSENVKEIPPSGLVAGMYARIDSTRGVWKAPAGTESNLSGALALSYKTTDTEHDILNPFGINCVRQFPGSGIVIWGSRTLGLKSKPEWKYIPVRRMAIFLRVSIYNGIQWAVFEPNDE
ncbi:MAG: phage tail sheath family protein, partial [Proteobacteria bacterium]|nr:phage tail sheath family protein [Pseudomonadota bacterium]